MWFEMFELFIIYNGGTKKYYYTIYYYYEINIK